MAELEGEKLIVSQEKKPFSFVLPKKKEVKILEKKEHKETDFVHALEGQEVKRLVSKDQTKCIYFIHTKSFKVLLSFLSSFHPHMPSHQYAWRGNAFRLIILLLVSISCSS